MGLFLAKQYIETEKKGITIHYKDKSLVLNKDERYLCPDDDFLELIYTGDEIKITHGNQDRLIVNSVDNSLVFTIIETNEESTYRNDVIFPLTLKFSEIRVIKQVEKE